MAVEDCKRAKAEFVLTIVKAVQADVLVGVGGLRTIPYRLVVLVHEKYA